MKMKSEFINSFLWERRGHSGEMIQMDALIMIGLKGKAGVHFDGVY